MKLKLKHLAAYLPYGLRCNCMGLFVDDFADDKISVVVEMVGLTTEHVEIHEIGRTVTEQYYLSDIYPILRPLSDLTKEIEVNGERFVPIEKIAIYGNNKGYLEEAILTGLVEVIVFNMLISWHFDAFGLIEAGLAIDINTLTT